MEDNKIKPNKVKNTKLKKILVYIFFAPFILIAFAFVFTLPPTQGFFAVIFGHPSYSEGVRVGQVIKFSEKGYFFKTYEGDLLLTQSGNSSVNRDSVWQFSVPKNSPNAPKFIEDINLAIKNGSVIEIRYDQKIFRKFWEGDTVYYVLSIDF